MTTNREIDRLLGPSSYSYHGTYASDFLPRRNFTSFPTSLIINLSKHNIQEAGHYVAVYETHRDIYYFDSFALNPSVLNATPVCNLLDRSGKRQHFNVTPIQSVYSDKCAYFCIAFILFFDKISKKSIDNFVKLFHQNTRDNDEIVLEIMKQLK